MQTDKLDQLRSLRGLIIDMDGTIWLGDQPLPGLVRFFEVLRRKEIKFILATNNNTQTPQGFIQKAAGMGVEIKTDEVMTASLATVEYLKTHYPQGSPVYVVGEAPFKGLISEAGFFLTEKDPVAVVATMDRGLTYDMLKRATLLIRAGADFIAPNGDKNYPTQEGIVPGAGAVLAAIIAGSERLPRIMGKPESALFDISLARMGLPAGEVASLGDRLDTDIEGGLRAGLKTILVLSGVTSAEEAGRSPIKADWIASGIDELSNLLS